MQLNINQIFSRKNLTYIVTGIALAVLFLILSGFSLSAVIVIAALVIGYYLFFFHKQSELLCYALICSLFFIFFYLITIVQWPVWTILVLIAICLYLLFTNFAGINIDRQLNPVYTVILILAISEIFLITSSLEMAIIIKSLIIVIGYYLISGLISLNVSNDLKTKPILTYSVIFSVIMVLLIYIARI